jgi:hypothetical protein
MTSNTTPSGVAFSEQVIRSGYEAYRAFDGSDSTDVRSNTDLVNHDVAYDFTTPVKVSFASYLIAFYISVKIQYSDNGTTWTDASDTISLTSANSQSGTIATYSNVGEHRYWRFYGSQGSAGAGYIFSIKFYGKDYDPYIWLEAICNSTYFESVLNVKVPTMTSNTTPSGIAFANGTYNASYPAYLAFNNNESDGWLSSAGVGNKIVGYIFTEAKVCKCIKNANLSVRVTSLDSDWYIQGSNDTTNGTDGTWTYLGMTPSNSTSTLVRVTTAILNNNSYKAYRIYVRIASGSDNFYVSSRELQFYGREDV